MPIRNDITKSRVLRAIDQFNPNDGYITLEDVRKELFCDWATARKHVGMYEETRNAFLSKQEASLDYAEKAIFSAAKTDISALKYLLSTKGRHRGYGLPIATGTAQNDILGIDTQQNDSGGYIIKPSNEDLNAIEAILKKSKTIDTDFLEIEQQTDEVLLNDNEETKVYEMAVKTV